MWVGAAEFTLKMQLLWTKEEELGSAAPVVKEMKVELQRARDKNKVREADLLMLPFRVKNHWILIEVEPHKEKVSVCLAGEGKQMLAH